VRLGGFIMEIFEKFETENIKNNRRICGINYTQKILAGKWKITIIWLLKNEAKRYSEIKKFLSNISQGSLTKQLRELEEDEIIGRKIYPEVPPRVEYFLTEKGKRLTPILDSMEEFGNFYIDEYLKNH
jgi:putative transcriptional regulator